MEVSVITVNEALKILEANIPEPRIIHVDLEGAHGRYLGEDIHAPEPSPRYTNSAMDGFALRWQDCATASEETPVTLKVIGESQAGIPFEGEVREHCAVRISTGAMLPDGADTIVRVEDTEDSGDTVAIRVAPASGKDVRYAGEEFEEGTLLFQKQQQLKAREVALLAAVGLTRIPVFDQPRVSMLVTGTELSTPENTAILPHQIRDSNSIMLQSGIRETGAALGIHKQVADSLECTRDAILEVVDRGDDLILCSGGVSVGRHDHVKDAAKLAGFSELFWKIKQKPGKPLFVARRKNTLLFGLPGNPVSAYMCFNNYVRPVLARLQGKHVHTPTATAMAEEEVVNTGKRTNFIRVSVEFKPNEIARIKEVAQQGSHMLSSIVHADGYIILEPGETLSPGGLIEVYLF